MTMQNWAKEDQPREKLLSAGPQAISDAELIAILIKTGTKGCHAVALAKQLLSQHNGLMGLFQSLTEHSTLKGIGPAKLCTLLAVKAVNQRISQSLLKIGERLNNTQLTQAFLAQQLQYESREVFACLFLDNHLRLIKYETLFFGTINEVSVYPREIIRRALLYNAAKLIIAHNHPAGQPQPSQSDIELTKLIKRALSFVDVDLVDHIIIAGGTHFSFAADNETVALFT